MPPAISITTLADCLTHGHGVSVFCVACRRWVNVDLRRLVERGYGGRVLTGYRPRCIVCHARGEIQLRPPMPGFSGFQEHAAVRR